MTRQSDMGIPKRNWVCGSCGQHTKITPPSEDVQCPHCGTNGMWEPTTDLIKEIHKELESTIVGDTIKFANSSGTATLGTVSSRGDHYVTVDIDGKHSFLIAYSPEDIPDLATTYNTGNNGLSDREATDKLVHYRVVERPHTDLNNSISNPQIARQLD